MGMVLDQDQQIAIVKTLGNLASKFYTESKERRRNATAH